jgi:hypothetical protein
MRYAPHESTDIGQVVQALSNGIRSDLEITKIARLRLSRVQAALVSLVAHGQALGSTDGLFRLTDKGNDMVKEANAAQRKQSALRAESAVMHATQTTTIPSATCRNGNAVLHPEKIYISQLSEARLVATTEDLNRIADEIRDASMRASTHDDAAIRPVHDTGSQFSRP